MNIGPCGNLTLGEPAFLSEEFSNRVNIDLEIATTSGYGKNGALCILQKSIRPQVVTTYTLPGCYNVWTVCNGSDKHAFLLLGREEDTLVLQVKNFNTFDSFRFIIQLLLIFAYVIIYCYRLVKKLMR